MVSTLTTALEPALEQLRILGYQEGDRVWLRLIQPKKLPADVALRRRLAFEPEPGKVVPIPIEGYLTLLDGDFSFTRIKRDRETREVIKETVSRDGLSALTVLNDRGYGVYLVINPGGREDSDISQCRSLFYECDGTSKEQQWQRLRDLERLLGRKASLVVETRNSLHVYFLLDEPLDPHQWTVFQQRLIQQQDSDPAIQNPSRLMRLAGFDHQKWNEETKQLEATTVQIVQTSAATFSVSEFDRLLPAWDENRWGKGSKGRQQSGSSAPVELPASDPTGDCWDIRNLAPYLDSYSDRNRRGWFTCKCPAHNGDSNDSLHIEETSGAFKCHAGCDPKAVYKAALQLAQARGHQVTGKRPKGNSRSPLPSYELTHPVQLEMNQRYLGRVKVPKTARIVGLKAPKGTGKTEAITYLVEDAIAAGQRVLIGSHRVQLCQALCDRFGIPSIYALNQAVEQSPKEECQQLWQIYKQKGGGICFDSLHPNSQAHFRSEDWEDCLIILDEAEQGIWHLFNSGTCQGDRVPILREFKDLIARVLHPESSGRLILSDADLSDLTLNLALALGTSEGTKPETWICVNQWKHDNPWLVHLYEGTKEDWLAALEQAIGNGETVFVCTDGQKLKGKFSTSNLEKRWARKFLGKRILRIDRQTLGLRNHPAFGCVSKLNEVLAEYDIVICSPSIETGVSIDLKGHFTSVWGLFHGCISENSARQFLSRYRDPVPRHVWAASYGVGQIAGGAVEVRELQDSQNKIVKAHLHLISDSAIDNGAIDFDFIKAGMTCWAKMTARINAGMVAYRRAIAAGLKQEGHDVVPVVEELCPDERKLLREALTANRDQNQQEHGEALAACVLISKHEAEQLEEARSKENEQEQLKLEKFKLHERYGAIEVTPDLYLKDCDNWHPKIRLHYYLSEGQQYLKERDRAKRDELIDQQQAWAPDLSRSLLSAQVETLKFSRIVQLLTKEEWRNSDSDLIELRTWAFTYAPDIKQVLGFRLDIGDSPESVAEKQRQIEAGEEGIKINTGNSPIEVARKFLDKLGLALECIRKEGGRGQQQRVYKLCGLDDGRAAVFAAWTQRNEERRAKAAEQAKQEEAWKARAEKMYQIDTVVSTGNKDLYPSLTTKPADYHSAPPDVSASSEPLRHLAGALVKWKTSLSTWVIEAIDGTTAKVRQVSGWASAMVWDAPLDELREVTS